MHPRAQGLLQFGKLGPHPLCHGFPPHLEILSGWSPEVREILERYVGCGS